MNANIDSRIVELQFDNQQFQKEVANSLSSLKNLDSQLMLKNGTQGFSAVQKSANKLDMSNVQKQTSHIESALLKVKDVGVGVFGALTDAVGLFVKGAGLITGVLNTGVVAKSIQGGWSRASNIGAAKFQLEGLGVQWEQISDSLNFAVDQTAYGLDAAAVAASSLVASGVELGENMSHSLRAISGVAAMTNSTYEDTARIFTTVAGNGRLMGDQLLQLSSRGLNVAAVMAEAMGKSEAEIRDMVSKGKIDFNMFSELMYTTFGDHAMKANETFSGALSNISSALSRTTADFFLKIRGKEGLVPIFNDVRMLINDLNKQTNPLMHIFKDSEGNEKNGAIIQGVLNTLQEIHRVLSLKLETGSFVEQFGNMVKRYTPDINAFFNFFNKGVGNIVYMMFDVVEIFMTAATTFSPYLDAIRHAFMDTFGNSAFGKMTSNMHAGLQEFRRWIETLKPTSDQLRAVYTVAKQVFGVLANVTNFIGDLVDNAFHTFVNGGTAVNDWFKDFVDRSFNAEKAAGSLSDKIKEGFGLGITAKVKNFFKGFKEGVIGLFEGEDGKPIDVMEGITSGIENAWTVIQRILDPVQLSQLVNSLLAILSPLMALFLQFRGVDMLNRLSLLPDKLIDRMKTVTTIPQRFGEMITSISAGVTRLTKAATHKANAEALLSMAKAIGILAASLVVLTMVDPDRLDGAAVALFDMAGILIIITALMQRMDGLERFSDSMNMGAMATAMVPIAIAIDLLSVAVAKLAAIHPDRISQGITAVMELMFMVAIIAALLQGMKGFAAAAVGMVIIAGAVSLMGMAVKKFAEEFTDDEFETGLNRAAFSLLAMAGAMFIAASATGSAVKAAVGMGIMILALNGFLMMLRGFSSIDESDIQKTLGTLAAVLIGLGIAVAVFSSQTMVKGTQNLNAAMGAIGMMAIVINLIAFAIKNVMQAAGGDLAILITSMVGLAVVIVVMSAALFQLSKNAVAYDAGAASLLIMSAALLVLAKTITVLEAVPWGSLIMAFLKLGVAVLGLALLGVLADGLAVPLLDLAVVLGALSLALLMGSSALFLFAGALQIIATLGGATVENIIYAMVRIAQAIYEHKDEIVGAAATAGEAAGAALLGALKGIIMGLGDILATAIPAISSFLDEHGSDIVNIGVQIGKLLVTGFATAITEIPKMLWDATSAINNVPDDAVVEFNEYGYTIVGSAVEGTEKAADELANNEAMPEAVAENAEKAGEGAEGPLASSLTKATNNALQTASEDANPDSFDLSNIFSEGGMNLDALSDSLLGDAEGIGGGLSSSLLKGAGEKPVDINSLMNDLNLNENTLGTAFSGLGTNVGGMFSSGLTEGFGGEEGRGAVNSALDTELESANSRAEEFRLPGHTAGEAYGSGMVEGISMTDISGATNGNIAKMAEATGPARNTGTTVGNEFGSGEAVGIVQRGSVVSGAASSITGSAKYNAGGYDRGREVGSAFGTGMGIGIYNKSNYVANAAIKIVKDALAAAKEEADSHSPSRKTMEQGENFGEGYAIGILNTVASVATAAKAMAGSGLDAVEGTVLKTSSLLNMVDWNSDPVITPVLDLSEVERGVGIMDKMMVNGQVRAAAHADRLYSSSRLESQNGGDTNIEVHLDWHAGTSANQMAQALANELSLYRATEGR